MTYEVGGSLSYDTPNYVVRRADAELYAGLKAGKFCYVLNARQMGKSSLLVRTKHRLEQVGFRCAAIDMTGIGSEIVTPLQWYKGVVSELWLELGLLGKLDLKTWWRDEDDLSILQRLSRFINDLLWVHFPQDRLVIFVDEIDCSLSLDFPVDDFFGLIRFCYNQRALNPDYHRITFALFGAATPSDLIRDKIRTSFNIGQAIELQGFRPEEAQPLARELSLRTDDAQTVLRAVLNWTGGQPFLTQKLCQLVVNSVEAKHRTQQSSPQSTDQLAHASRLRIPPDAEEFWVESVVRSRILAHWESQDEPEHLRTIRDRLQRNQQWLGRLLSIYQQVLLFEQVGGDGEAGEAGGKAGRDGGEELTPKSKIQSPKSKIQNPKSKILPVFADDSREQIELLLSGLVVKDRGRLKVKNRIYREVFNLEWVDNQLAALRPYSQAFDAWVASQQQDQSRLLRGHALRDAQTWSHGKNLSDLDYQFLAASQDLERQAIQQALAAARTREAETRLIEEQKRLIHEQKVTRLQRLLLGAVSTVFVITTGLGIIAFRQYRQAALNELNALITSSKGLINSNEPFDALLEAIKAKHRLRRLGKGNVQIQVRVDSVLQQALYNVTEVNRLSGHDDSVNAVAFSPDGEIIATASDDHTVRLWRLDGAILSVLEGHNGFILDIAFSPDGELIASASGDGTVKLWRRDGAGEFAAHLHKTLRGHNAGVYGVAFSPDGQTIASASGDQTIKLWRRDGALLKTLEGHRGEVWSVNFSPNGAVIASGSRDNTVRIWRRDGALLTTLEGHTAVIRGIGFSPDGELIATTSDDQTIKLWRRIKGDKFQARPYKTLRGHDAAVAGVAFSPDGKTMVTGSWDNTVKLWNRNGILLKTLRGHGDRVWDIDFSPDGATIASASWDNTVRLWKPNNTLVTTLDGHSAVVIGVAFSPDAQMIASGSDDHTIKLWRPEGILTTTLAGHTAEAYAVRFSPDGRLIASTSLDQTVRLWRLDGFMLETLIGHVGPVEALDFNPDGELLASGGHDKTIRLWRLEWQAAGLSAKHLQTLSGHDGPVWALDFSPDGDRLASASNDQTVKLWKRNSKHYFQTRPYMTLKGHKGAVRAVAISPDDELIASGSMDGTVRIWRRDGTLLTQFEDHAAGVRGVAFSPDGNLIASAGADETIKIWKKDGTLLTTLVRHRGTVWDVDFSADGQMLASAGEDLKVILWDLDQVLTLDLLAYGCNWVQDYLQTNAEVEARDRTLCSGVNP